MTRTAWMASVVALWFAGSALAVEPDLPDQVAEQVRAAEQVGLPVAPLQQKAREGLAKGLPPERIAPVLRRLTEQMRAAEGALGDAAQGPDRGEMLHAAAMARQAGATDEGLAEAAGEAHRVRAMWCFGDLLGLEAGEKEALRLVHAAAHSGEPEASYRETITAMRRLQESGMAPDAAARHMHQVMARGEPPMASIPEHAGGPAHAGDDGGMPWQGADDPPGGN
ncbi:MAG: hypothetical protein JRI25_28190 [Deltaproteobacteria bacterium]|nr:hypothetical protein [Deltaproteobacteria bacterium]MBW2258451.1 hypothetical protein [Deltaproteobacteria bacterium]